MNEAPEMAFRVALEMLNGVEDRGSFCSVGPGLHIEDKVALEDKFAELGIIFAAKRRWSFGVAFLLLRRRCLDDDWGRRWSRSRSRLVSL